MSIRHRRSRAFQLAAVTPTAVPDAAVAIAASRAGAVGLLDLTTGGAESWRGPTDALVAHGRPGRLGLRVEAARATALEPMLPPAVRWIVLAGGDGNEIAEALGVLEGRDVVRFVEVVNAGEA